MLSLECGRASGDTGNICQGGGVGDILTGSIHSMRLWCSSGLLGNLGQAVGDRRRGELSHLAHR